MSRPWTSGSKAPLSLSFAGGVGRSHGTAVTPGQISNVSLVIVAPLMQFEACYLREWVDSHLALLDACTIYLLPQLQGSDEAFVRNFGTSTPRVHALCAIHGAPVGCHSPNSTSYQTRNSHAELIGTYLAPRHRCAWFMVFDLDEFLTVSAASHTLTSVLRMFALMGADKVNVNWLVYGANGRRERPAGCRVLDMYPRPARATCQYNRVYKPIYRASSRLTPHRREHEYLTGARIEFASDGTNVSRCRAEGGCDAQALGGQTAAIHTNCSACRRPGGGALTYLAVARPLLVLRHYTTKSRQEYESKAALWRKHFYEIKGRYEPTGWLAFFNKFDGSGDGSGCGEAEETNGEHLRARSRPRARVVAPR